MVRVTYWSPIDGHVHLRGNEYSQVKPSFAELFFRDAKAVGLRAAVEEPNPEPYLHNRINICRRIKQIDIVRQKMGAMDINHGIAVALTSNPDQIKEALDLIWFNPRVVTAKSFMARTTKSEKLEIIAHPDQKYSWQETSNSPRGKIVREMHLEDEDMFKIEFDPSRPETHAYRQCPESEVIQFERQFGFAYDAGFKGIFLVKHTSNPDTIDLGDKLVKFDPPFKVMYETTPHHMFLNIEDDYPIHGNGVKMNPPLRPKEMQERLLEYGLAGRTHTIGTDHASHPFDQKIGPPHKSGIPVEPFYPMMIHLLREAGMKEDNVKRLTFDNPNQVYFNGYLAPREVTVEYNPSLWEAYGWNPFSRVDGTLKSA